MIDYTLPLDELPDPLPIEPLTKPFDVTITPPGSKSITCRAYVLAALAESESQIIRPLRADDTDKLLDALCTLGAAARWEGEDVFIKGVGGRFPRGGEVNLGDGGTPARFMIACACLAAEPVVVDGSARMRERPVAEGVDMLRQLGATIEYVEEERRLPVRVVPSESMIGGDLEIGETKSSQFISAILLIAPLISNGVTIRFKAAKITSKSYIDLTLDLLSQWSICSEDSKHSISVRNQSLRNCCKCVEADQSSAAYWMTAAVVGNSLIRIRGLSPDSNQADALMWYALEDIGMIISGDESETCVQGTGGWIFENREKDEFDMTLMPDASLSFVICAVVQDYPITISGLHTLRVKETDRIAALANELTKIGCGVETTEDSIKIIPSHRRDARATSEGENNPVVIETYNDHRMAMSFAVLGLARPGISISNPKCVAKSYPGFWKDFALLYV